MSPIFPRIAPSFDVMYEMEILRIIMALESMPNWRCRLPQFFSPQAVALDTQYDHVNTALVRMIIMERISFSALFSA